MKLVTEKEFDHIRSAKDYDTYRKTVKDTRKLSLTMIGEVITEVMGRKLKKDWLDEDTRTLDTMHARHYGRYIAYTFGYEAAKDIGRYFGGRTEYSVYNSLKVIEAIQNTNTDHPRNIELQKILEVLSEKTEQ